MRNLQHSTDTDPVKTCADKGHLSYLLWDISAICYGTSLLFAMGHLYLLRDI